MAPRSMRWRASGEQRKGGNSRLMTIRELTLLEEFDACMDLQRDGFGWSDIELMPMRFFVVSRHIGGLVLGAFDDGQLVGFLSAIPGLQRWQALLAFPHAGGLVRPSGFRNRQLNSSPPRGNRPFNTEYG